MCRLLSKADDNFLSFTSLHFEKHYIQWQYRLTWDLPKVVEMSFTMFSTGCHSPFQILLLVVQQVGPQHQEELNWLEVQLLATIKTTKQTYAQNNNKEKEPTPFGLK